MRENENLEPANIESIPGDTVLDPYNDAPTEPAKEITKYPWECLNLRFVKPLIESKTSPRFNVYSYRGKANWVVKLTLSNAQQVLGYFNDLETASRYADMATLVFHKFIKRPRYNFSEAQAKEDDSNDGFEIGNEDGGCGYAHFILARILNDYRGEGKLIEVPDSSRRPGEPRKRGRKQAELLQLVRRMQVTIDSQSHRISAVESRIAALESMKGLITIEGKTYINTGPAPDISPQQPITTPITPPTIWTAKQTDQQN